ncbi:hypothetical protein C2845_PM06G32930 [Panicum miliaceum]|uniref:Rx N-terminal domain-containing protein n=1 Tax=Panicum miliaceum TaxID=4540 RepID=A0A3L6R5V6_PANMI|nr:hypothetical protein C2845_PM06G32930 [Panicum miliaceum]
MESAAVGAFLKSVMGRLFLLLEKEYSKHRGLAQEAASIQHDLRMIAAAMDDQLGALGRPERTAVARLYSAEILDLAHDIEDCVDRFTHRLSYADEIHKLKRRLKEARQRVVDSAPVGRPGGLPSSATLDASKPCPAVTRNPAGMEKPMEEMLSLLREVDEISQRIKAILLDILQQVVPKDSMDLDADTNNLEALLKEYLSGKRYLIVIDGVQMDEWRAVNSAFVDSSAGSRIILTTTIQSVANVCSHGNG